MRRTKKGSTSEYLSVSYAVCTDGGGGAGSFFSMLPLDLTHHWAINKWRAYCSAVGVKESFELGASDDGTRDAGDRDIKRLFTGVPFVAVVARQTQGAYANSSIDQYVPKELVTAREAEIIALYSARRSAERELDDEMESRQDGNYTGPEEDEDGIPF